MKNKDIEDIIIEYCEGFEHLEFNYSDLPEMAEKIRGELLATLDKITMEIRDDAEDAICGTRRDEGRAMLETIERVRIAMGANQPW